VKAMTGSNSGASRLLKYYLSPTEQVHNSEAKNLTGVILYFQKEGEKKEYELEWLDTVGLNAKLKEYIKSKAENFDPIKEELTDEKRKLTDEEKKQIDVYAGLNTFII